MLYKFHASSEMYSEWAAQSWTSNISSKNLTVKCMSELIGCIIHRNVYTKALEEMYEKAKFKFRLANFVIILTLR